MAAARPVLALVALASLIAGAAALAAWQQGAAGPEGTYGVLVTGPEGDLFEGDVKVERATALSLLLQAAEHGGFEVETREYPGMGTYVVAIGGHRATGASGWVYEVLVGDAWVSGDRSAEAYPIQPGESLRWTWTA